MTPEFYSLPAAFNGELLLDTVAPTLDLVIDPAYRPGTLIYLEFTARMARFVMDFELPDTLEPAPIFRP